jgi:sec-independent protein translocase protein TatA
MGLDNPLHIAFLVIILLLVFGAKRLPEMGRSLGSGMREFKDSISGESAHAQAQPTLSQTTQQPAPAPVAPQASAQQAAQPLAPVPEQAPATVEPTRQA